MFSYYYNDKLDQKIKNDDELAFLGYLKAHHYQHYAILIKIDYLLNFKQFSKMIIFINFEGSLYVQLSMKK